MSIFDDFKIKVSGYPMPNGETRFRMESQEDGSSYTRTIAGKIGGWQQSHLHKQGFETYLAQSGWICVVSLINNCPMYSLVTPGELITIPPNIIHNIYMPSSSIMHTIKHGNTLNGDRSTSPESSLLDSLTQSVVEIDILKNCTEISKYPPAEPGALLSEPLKAAGGVANAAPFR